MWIGATALSASTCAGLPPDVGLWCPMPRDTQRCTSKLTSKRSYAPIPAETDAQAIVADLHALVPQGLARFGRHTLEADDVLGGTERAIGMERQKRIGLPSVVNAAR